MDINKFLTKAEKIKKIRENFPDLEIKTNRWGNDWLASAQVNNLADNVDLIHSCGCCEDAVLYAMPYIIVDETKIYSDPSQISIGERCYCGERPDSDWQEELKKHGIINQNIFEHIEKFFKDHDPDINDE